MSFEKLNFEGISDPEAEMEAELDSQEHQLNKEAEEKGYGKLAKIARKLIFTGTLLLPAFAVGCGAVEKPNKSESMEKPAAVQKADKGGFTDNVHENVQRRLEMKKNEIKKMKESRKGSAEQRKAAKEAVEEMQKPMIDQDL